VLGGVKRKEGGDAEKKRLRRPYSWSRFAYLVETGHQLKDDGIFQGDKPQTEGFKISLKRLVEIRKVLG